MIKIILQKVLFLLPYWVNATPLDCDYYAKIFDNTEFQNHACEVIESLQDYHGVSIREYTINYDENKNIVYFECSQGNGYKICSITKKGINL